MGFYNFSISCITKMTDKPFCFIKTNKSFKIQLGNENGRKYNTPPPKKKHSLDCLLANCDCFS